jgi:hypothetical protein
MYIKENVYVCIYTHTFYTNIYRYMCLVCVYVHMYVCMYIYIHTYYVNITYTCFM